MAQIANPSAENTRGRTNSFSTEDYVMLCDGAYQWRVGTSSWACEPRRTEPQRTASGQKVQPLEPALEPWREIDRKLRRIAKRRAALDNEELQLIRAAIVHAIWRELGMTSIREYLENAMGYGPTVASERVRVTEALDAMPVLERALATGELPYSAVREITRIATSKTEGAWVATCRGKNLREIEDLLAEREPGDRPESPRNPDLRMRDLRFKVRPATEANVRIARQILEAELGERLDHDELLDALAQRVISGGATRERAASQIAITFCPHCQIARQTAAGTAIALRPEELECALCDAEWIDVQGQVRSRQDVTPAVRKAVRLRDHDRCRVPGCRAARNIDVHHIVPRWQGGSHEPENLLLLCSGHHKALHRGAIRIEGPASCAVVTKLYGADLDIESAPADVESAFHVEDEAASFHVESASAEAETEAASRVRKEAADFHVESVLRDAEAQRLQADGRVRADALLALRSLGFTQAEATAAVTAALDEVDSPLVLEPLLRASLRNCPKPIQ